MQIHYIELDKSNGVVASDVPQKMKIFDLPEQQRYDNRQFVFDNKIIKSKSVGGKIIECLENGKNIWQFKHWAYLYTDIIEKNGCIIFGTDGMGSRLYCLDIQTGKILSETKTHFSGFYNYKGFNWHKENIVAYGKNSIIVINPFSGEILDEHKIPSKYPYRSFLQVINGYAYCCVLTNDNRPTIFCFALN